MKRTMKAALRRACAVLGLGLLAAACGEGTLTSTWTVDHHEEGGALLSVWGTGPSDVWAAGGQVGQGLVLHNDGTAWQRVECGADQLLWWVYGFAPNDVYAVGERGLILHYDGAVWRRIQSGTDKTLYGVWGASGDDVWIVGGDAAGSAGEAVVLRGSSREFHLVEDVPAELLPNALFKVYGGPLGVVMVGGRGTVLRAEISNGANSTVWRRESTPTNESLFSLWGRGDDDVYAVGGIGSGEVLHFDGREWLRVNEESLGRGLSGVFTAPGEPMIAVGADSYVVEIGLDGDEVEPQLPVLDQRPSLHGVWGDSAGTTYAVGGELNAYPGVMRGVIFRRH